jgi:hypothetical protein
MLRRVSTAGIILAVGTRAEAVIRAEAVMRVDIPAANITINAIAFASYLLRFAMRLPPLSTL